MFQHFDFESRMRFAKPLKIFQREQMTLYIRIGDDVGGTRRAVNESHFAKRPSRRKRGEAMPFLAGQKHADISAREEKNFAGGVTGVDDVLPAREGARLQQRLDRLQLRAGKAFEKLIVGGLGFVVGGVGEPGVFEQPLLAPL